jgi:hypothetical protein
MPPPPPGRPARFPAWAKIVTSVWVAALLLGAIWYAWHGRASVREQTSIGQARPTVDRATADVVAAAGSGPVVAVGAFERVGSCRITAIRSGATYRREVDLYTSPGTESAMMHAVATGLPSRYRASATSTGHPTLDADAGDYVAINGTVPAPGTVRIDVLTGCRPEAGAPVATPSADPGSIGVQAIEPVIRALGRSTATIVTVADLACPAGGVLRSVRAALPSGSSPPSLASTLGNLARTPAASSAKAYAYRSGAVDVVVRSTNRAVTITATTRCGT